MENNQDTDYQIAIFNRSTLNLITHFFLHYIFLFKLLYPSTGVNHSNFAIISTVLLPTYTKINVSIKNALPMKLSKKQLNKM